MQENNMMIPGISLCQKWGKIRIFHSTIVALGEPRYIRFLFNPDKKGLVVQACARTGNFLIFQSSFIYRETEKSTARVEAVVMPPVPNHYCHTSSSGPQKTR